MTDSSSAPTSPAIMTDASSVPPMWHERLKDICAEKLFPPLNYYTEKQDAKTTAHIFIGTSVFTADGDDDDAAIENAARKAVKLFDSQRKMFPS